MTLSFLSFFPADSYRDFVATKVVGGYRDKVTPVSKLYIFQLSSRVNSYLQNAVTYTNVFV